MLSPGKISFLEEKGLFGVGKNEEEPVNITSPNSDRSFVVGYNLMHFNPFSPQNFLI